MEPIEKERLQSLLDSFLNEDVYLHLETTNGAYASHFDESFFQPAPTSAMPLFRTNMALSLATDHTELG